MSNINIMIVEDDSSLRQALIDTLDLANLANVAAKDAIEALVLLEDYYPDLILSDMQMPRMNGLDFMLKARAKYPGIPFLLMTAFASIESAVQAMRQGATDYITKPFEPKILIEKINSLLQHSIKESGPIIVDPKSKQLFAMAAKVAQSDASVLISGASGTGKEVLARFIHDNSARSKSAFVAINCAAIPDNMLEASLFGYEKGAFTGAQRSYPGKFEQAQHGTLLLDEISEMPLDLQAKLLRVLQEKEVERIGGQKTISLDVRIIATSNRDLKQWVTEGKFREDLYYRLNVFPLYWQQLSQRSLDIIPLATYLLHKHAKTMQRLVPHISPQAKIKLQQHSWPGNVREMDNVMQRALIIAQGDTLEPSDLQLETAEVQNVKNNDVAQIEMKLSDGLRDKEFSIILSAAKESNGNRKDMAKKLGISSRTLRYKIAKMRDAGIKLD